MIVLKSTDTLEIKLGAAKTTLDNPVTVHFTDIDTTSFEVVGIDRQLSTTNGTSVVTICAAPSAGHVRVIKKLTLPVKDTGSIAVTLQINSSAVIYELMIGTALAVGDLLQDDGE